jgi:hypothetical protein
MRVVEREEFRRLCLLLHPELCPADIPHRTTMQKRILDTFSDVIQDMSEHIQVILSCDLMAFG